MLIDNVVIQVAAGHGGAGAVSFRRERFVPRGGPDGGDGGRGGDVVLVVDHGIRTLSDFRRKRLWRADHGKAGSGRGSHGRKGQDLVISIPSGTDVYAQDSTIPLVEMLQHQQRFILARGGKGGRGNKHFATAVHQTPRFAEPGEPGEQGRFRLELRLLADVGIIGLPNVGKSTLLATATKAVPKIGDYPFTTLEPQLGIVDVGYESFVLADIPGLVEGAAQGAGLGVQFLQHIQRTRLLLHMIAGDSNGPLADAMRINSELRQFDHKLAELPQILVVNKIDLPEVAARRAEIEEQLKPLGKSVFFISAATGESVRPLMDQMNRLLKTLSEVSAPEAQEEGFQVFRPKARAPKAVRRDGSKYVLEGGSVPRITVPRDVSAREQEQMLRERVRRTGWQRVLEQAGIQPGDTVQVGEVEFAW